MKEYAPSGSDFFSLKSSSILFLQVNERQKSCTPTPLVKEWLETISRWSLTSV